MKKTKIILSSIVLFSMLGLIFVHANYTPNQEEAYRREFHGEGIVVAVIDGGADITHPDLQLSDASEAKLTEEMVQNIISSEKLSGKYVNEKIPYVHDYYHNDNDIFSKDEHGLHVAGIVGANGKVKGIAPEVQLLLMKVFPDSGINTLLDSDIYYVQAILDAIKLHADIINLSLGTGAGTTYLLSDEVKNAIHQAVQAGIVVNIACGNNGFFGFTQAYPKAENPDYGVTSMPAILSDAIAVASVDGQTLSATMLLIDGNKYPYQVAYKDSLSIASDLPYGEEIELVDVGYGTEDEYKNKIVEDKIVIASRGKETFRQLQRIASKQKAKAMIIYNREQDIDEIFELDGSEFSIPVAIMKYKDAKDVLKKIENGKEIIFLQEPESYLNPNQGKMSSFSAWGLSNEGNLKPDITAPGGDILSLGNHGTYIRMSGTSMATPYISAVSALILQRLNETYETELTTEEKYKLVKRILMSTAQQHEMNGILTSPRKQGVGIVDIKGAVASQVIAYADENNVSLNLKDIQNELIIPVVLQNISQKKVTLKGSYTLLADVVKQGRFTMQSKIVKQGDVDEIELLPNEVKTVSYHLDVSDIDLHKEMKNGYYLDGFITYSYGKKKPNVSVAFTSFKGEYEKLPILEEPIYNIAKYDATYMDQENYTNYFTHFGSSILVGDEEKHIVLGEMEDSVIGNRKFDGKHIAISPNEDNKADHLEFIFTALRTYQKVQIDIYNQDHKMIETFAQIKRPEFIKNYYGGNSNNPMALTLWDYIPKNQPSGKYYAKISVQRFMDGSNSIQSFEYPFYIDNEAPKLLDYKIEEDLLEVHCQDNLSGIYSVKLKVDNHTIKAESDGKFRITGIDQKKIRIYMLDYAFNENIVSLQK